MTARPRRQVTTLFYGDTVSVKSSINMMMMTRGAVAVVGVLCVLFGFSEQE